MSNFLKVWGFLLSILITTFSCSICVAYSNSNQTNFDVCYYEINISIDPQNETVDGLVTVEAINARSVSKSFSDRSDGQCCWTQS